MGAVFGALAAYIYLRYKINKNKKLFESAEEKDNNIDNKQIAKKIIFYCIPLIIISITNDLYNIIDMKLIIKGLYIIGFSPTKCELISSIVCTWAPKICMIISAISMGLITSLIPHIIESYTKKDYKSSNKIFNQAISTMLIIALPLTMGIIILAGDVYHIFYGSSPYGGKILAVSGIVSLIIGILSVMNTALQGFKKFKLVIISTAIGLLINTILDIPMIILLNKIGLTPYIGTSISSIIGALTSIVIILIYLKKNFNFNYSSIGKIIAKTIVPLFIMSIVVFGLNIVMGTKESTIFTFIKVAVLAIIGLVVYLVLLYKNNGLNSIFGKDKIDNIMKKIHLK